MSLFFALGCAQNRRHHSLARPLIAFEKVTLMKRAFLMSFVLAVAPVLLGAGAANAQSTLRVAMTAADIPTTTGMPNNGFEGMTFTGYTMFEPLIQWDLRQTKEAGKIMPGLATSWESDPKDRSRWIFRLRDNVKFHDGSPFDADAAIWNLARFYDDKSPQYEANGAAIVRGRVPVKSWEKIDDRTIAIVTSRPTSYFPLQVPYLLFGSPAAFEKAGRNWAEVAKAPSGTGPFRMGRVVPRVSVELTRNQEYWDKARIPKVDRLMLFPMPEATTRVAALRSGQVDYIAAPPPDSIASLKAAKFRIEMAKDVPSVWTYMLMTQGNSPFADKRVRQAANYAVDRAGLVKLMNGTAVAAPAYWSSDSPAYGKPANSYTYDPARSLALIKQAGLSPPVKATILIPNSGSGMMLPVQINEAMQQSMAKAGFDIKFKVVEYGEIVVAARQPPTAPQNSGADALNVALVTDIASTYRWFPSSSFTPQGNNWGHWGNPEMDSLMGEIAGEFDSSRATQKLRRMHEIVVDEAPWLYVIRDLQPTALSGKVEGRVAAPSFFVDLTAISVRK